MAGFDAVREQIDQDIAAARSSQAETTEENKEQTQSAPDNQDEVVKEAKAEAQAILDLEKAGKFRFDGRELTAKELKSMIMRQEDYTRKTQSLAEERKAFEADSKFRDNLSYDIENVRRNPALASEFIKVYPEKFHKELRDALSNTQHATQSQGQSNTPQIPIELMSQVQKLETFVHQQEVAKAESEIEGNLTKVLGEFKYASRKEVLADAFELHNRGTKLTAEIWNQIAKDSHDSRKTEFDQYYKELVKQQTQANSKARDVGAGGGTPGQAPKKFDPKRGMAGLSKDVRQAFESQKN